MCKCFISLKNKAWSIALNILGISYYLSCQLNMIHASPFTSPLQNYEWPKGDAPFPYP